jgi:hypothetical protein
MPLPVAALQTFAGAAYMTAAADSWQAAPQIIQRNRSVVTDKIIISENQAKLH